MKVQNRRGQKERQDRFLRTPAVFLAIVRFGLMLSISGCSNVSPEEATVSEAVLDAPVISEEPQEDTEEIINICIDIYKKAAEEKSSTDLETIRSIVNCFGENGYPAVDSRNQVDMTEAEQVLSFCEKVDAQVEADITIFQISYLDGFVKYDLHTEDGKVDVVKSYYNYKNGSLQREVTGSYQAEYWHYTDEGYLMFSGVWFSEELYALTLSGAEGHVALRVQPLDEAYRELGRKYLHPISFERNNMFLVDWSEDDFGDLNFYDMYDILYPKVHGQYVPYVADDNLSVSAVYRISKEEFESVIMKYFDIDSETLQSKTIYHPEDSTYEYKPRGFEEVEYPEYPYSEVTCYTENSDGTITLTANVVFPYAGNSRVYAHEVVVRPLENGGVQYVSNRMIPSDDNCGETWHTPRLTLEEWEKGYGLPVDEQEEQEAANDCRAMMEHIFEIYREADKGTTVNVVLTDETILELQKKLMETGYPVATLRTYSNMGNYKRVDSFLEDCTAGKSGSVVIYEIHNDGGLGRRKFCFDGADMYVVGARSVWDENGRPGMSYISYTRIKEWEYTDKGWFCYKLCVPEPPEVSEIMDGSCLLRVKPMTEKQRELSARCVRGLGYQGNNLLCSNWDADHMEELDFNGMYEYLYAMKYGETFTSEDYSDGIPREQFERLIMEYLPITKEQIREYAVFDEENQTYAWARLGCFNYAPTFFGTSLPEVVSINENEDDTITLTVEAVCGMVICDDAVITHELTVKFAEDGSFQYLGNKILNDGIQCIPDYQYRVKE